MRKSYLRIIAVIFGFLIAFTAWDWFHNGFVTGLFTEWNQAINDIYMIAYGAIIVMMMIGYHNKARNKDIAKLEMAMVLLLMVGYVEDTLYYLFMAIWNPFNKVLPFDGIFPPEIGGWMGFVGRLFSKKIALDIEFVFYYNAVTIAIVLAVTALIKVNVFDRPRLYREVALDIDG